MDEPHAQKDLSGGEAREHIQVALVRSLELEFTRYIADGPNLLRGLMGENRSVGDALMSWWGSRVARRCSEIASRLIRDITFPLVFPLSPLLHGRLSHDNDA